MLRLYTQADRTTMGNERETLRLGRVSLTDKNAENTTNSFEQKLTRLFLGLWRNRLKKKTVVLVIVFSFRVDFCQNGTD